MGGPKQGQIPEAEKYKWKQVDGLKHGGTGTGGQRPTRAPFICLNVHLSADCSIEYKMTLCLLLSVVSFI